MRVLPQGVCTERLDWDTLWELPERTKRQFGSVFVFVFILLFRAATMAYGGSQARGLMGAVAAGLCLSHSNAGSQLRLQPTPQLPATLDP